MARLWRVLLAAAAAHGARYVHFDAFSEETCDGRGRFKADYWREDACMNMGSPTRASDVSFGFLGGALEVFNTFGCGADQRIWSRALAFAGGCLATFPRILVGIENAFVVERAGAVAEASVAADGLIVEAWYWPAAHERARPCAGEPDHFVAYERGACYKVPAMTRRLLFLSRDDDLYVRRTCGEDGAEAERYFADAACAGPEVDPTLYDNFGPASHAYGGLVPGACVSEDGMYHSGRNWGCARPAGPVGPFYWVPAARTASSTRVEGRRAGERDGAQLDGHPGADGLLVLEEEVVAERPDAPVRRRWRGRRGHTRLRLRLLHLQAHARRKGGRQRGEGRRARRGPGAGARRHRRGGGASAFAAARLRAGDVRLSLPAGLADDIRLPPRAAGARVHAARLGLSHHHHPPDPLRARRHSLRTHH